MKKCLLTVIHSTIQNPHTIFMSDGIGKDWKLKLRYGKLSTQFEHYALLAYGQIFDASNNENSDVGPAIMTMKVWASSHDEAFDMIRDIGEDVGFQVTGRIQLYDTDPEEPPREAPYGYDINFTTYEDGS